MLLRLIDTTLRDGAQRPGMRWTRSQRMWFALALSRLPWVAEMEVGIPATSPEEADFVAELASMNLPCGVTAWNRMHEGDIRASMRTGVRRIHITVPASRLHLNRKLGIPLAEACARLTRLADMARSGGHEVAMGLEDASRAEVEDLAAWVAAGLAGGVDRFRLADTVGVWHPRSVTACIRELQARTGPVALAVHTHDDLGMACANAHAAARAGVEWVDVTVCGIGERAGNCATRDLLEVSGLSTEGLLPLERALAMFNPGCVGDSARHPAWHAM